MGDEAKRQAWKREQRTKQLNLTASKQLEKHQLALLKLFLGEVTLSPYFPSPSLNNSDMSFSCPKNPNNKQKNNQEPPTEGLWTLQR